MSTVFEVLSDGEVRILGHDPVKTKKFMNLDAVLDFCRFAEPEEMNIRRLYSGGHGFSEVVGYELNYIGSKGDR